MRLLLEFGQAVQLEYYDAARAEVERAFPEVIAMARQQRWRYPLVAVNGELQLAGSADYWRIMPLVEEAMEATGVKVE